MGVVATELNGFGAIRFVRGAGAFVVFEGFLDKACIGALDDAAVVDHAAEAPDGVGAATEAEKEDLVAGGVVLNDVAVVVHDVLVEAFARGARRDAIVVGADTPVVENLLRHAVAAQGFDGAGEAEDIGGDVFFEILFGTVPGAIGADNDSLFHGMLASKCLGRVGSVGLLGAYLQAKM